MARNLINGVDENNYWQDVTLHASAKNLYFSKFWNRKDNTKNFLEHCHIHLEISRTKGERVNLKITSWGLGEFFFQNSKLILNIIDHNFSINPINF